LAACLLGWTGPAQAGWKTVFEDDFDGTELNRDAWYTRYIYNNGTLDTLRGEAQVYRDEGHIVVADGILKLIATYAPQAGRKQPYESGMIRSRQTFRYGYFEARIKIPSGKGLHPTWWLNSDYDENGHLSWPPEIDIMESAVNGTHETPKMIHSGTVTKKKNTQGGMFLSSDPKFNRRSGAYWADVDVSQDWHVYGLNWAADDTLTMYFDGKEIWKRKYRWVYNNKKPAGPAHMIFNLAVGGTWAGQNGIDKSIFPAILQVDYVRVCEPSDDPSASPRCGNSQFAPE
jgi:beta-glucanase (GH16 family)